MIDQKVFLQEIGILMDWYSCDFEPETLKRLHQRLSVHLTTEQLGASHFGKKPVIGENGKQ